MKLITKHKSDYNDYKYTDEMMELMENYINSNKQFYDFRDEFLHKLKTNKHLTNTELITLTGLAGAVKDKDLQLLLYKTLIEELVLITTSIKEWGSIWNKYYLKKYTLTKIV